jgi:Carboxypeptidase regulatory-like domain
VNFTKAGTHKKALGRNPGNWDLAPLVLVWLSLAILSWASPALARAQQPPVTLEGESDLPDSSGTGLAALDQQPDQQSPGSIKGTLVDPTGTPVPGARVKLSRGEQSPNQEVVTGDDGQFSLANITPGPFQLTITAAGFATETYSGTVRSGETCVVPPITLPLATAFTEVQVVLSPTEIAEEQIKEQEKQRVLGVIPNFYVTYVPDAAPLNAKQKFKLALRTTVDPVTFVVTGGVAGIEQSQNQFSGFGQGAQGYGKRYGAAYADMVVGTFIEGAILPSLLKQDPRYFYKGTGSKKSRILYAMANAVICKGDNGHWQPNYSGILGGFAAGGISTLYYPSDHSDGELVVENTLIGIGATAATNLLQEFVIRKLTPNLNKHNSANP